MRRRRRRRFATRCATYVCRRHDNVADLNAIFKHTYAHSGSGGINVQWLERIRCVIDSKICIRTASLVRKRCVLIRSQTEPLHHTIVVTRECGTVRDRGSEKKGCSATGLSVRLGEYLEQRWLPAPLSSPVELSGPLKSKFLAFLMSTTHTFACCLFLAHTALVSQRLRRRTAATATIRDEKRGERSTRRRTLRWRRRRYTTMTAAAAANTCTQTDSDIF